MLRRKLLMAIGAGAMALPRWATGQQEGRSYRVGWLSATDSFREPYGLAFIERLGQLGFVEGRNLSLERRHAGNRLDRLAAAAGELAKLRCDAFFAGGAEANLAALLGVSTETPIVFVAVDFDPIATGHAASLARPGGRITGLSANQSELTGKRLELLKELVPGARRVAVFTNDQTAGQLAVAQEGARRMGLALHVVDFKRPPFDYAAGFADATRANADALFVLGSGLWIPARRRIPELALKSRLPTMFHQSQWVEVGGLMSYGFNFTSMWRRGAEMVARILGGARASETPIEEPAVYELALNLKTANALGIRITPSMRLRAERIIE